MAEITPPVRHNDQAGDWSDAGGSTVDVQIDKSSDGGPFVYGPVTGTLPNGDTFIVVDPSTGHIRCTNSYQVQYDVSVGATPLRLILAISRGYTFELTYPSPN